ncbi:MAG TPA: hypothetical protein VF040_01345 [Ktedonobacterales bacterium]
MSWFALSHGFVENARDTNIWISVRLPQPPQPSQQPYRAAPSLGAATADARWRWASPRAGCVTPATVRDDEEAAATQLVVTRELRAEMAEMAYALGRSEDDVWAEAAREWLLRHMRDDEPPPTTPAAAPVPTVRTRRLWSEIDAMLADLRHPRYVAAPPEPTVPAA